MKKAKSSRILFKPGEIYSFRTAPFTKFSDQSTGRYAALKILAMDDRVTFVVLDRIWTHEPTFEEVLSADILHAERFQCSGRPALHYVLLDWEVDLTEFQFVGNQLVSARELSIIPKLRGYGSWLTASSEAEGEWRWRHDNERVRAEVRQEELEREASKADERHRYETRLKNLTWTKLRNEDFFSRWQRSPPFPPLHFTLSARAKVRQAIAELEALGEKPKRKDVRAILRTLVLWFNEEDARCGEVIETEEREDVYEVLRELAFVAGQQSLMVEADEWRSW